MAKPNYTGLNDLIKTDSHLRVWSIFNSTEPNTPILSERGRILALCGMTIRQFVLTVNAGHEFTLIHTNNDSGSIQGVRCSIALKAKHGLKTSDLLMVVHVGSSGYQYHPIETIRGIEIELSGYPLAEYGSCGELTIKERQNLMGNYHKAGLAGCDIRRSVMFGTRDEILLATMRAVGGSDRGPFKSGQCSMRAERRLS